MHTLMVVAAGVLLLAVFCLTGWALSGVGVARAVRLFIPVWLIALLVNMTIGVVSAGYTIAQEAPILLVVFGVPAIVAWLVAKRVGS
ncbi:hypothetical protein [Cognatishimia sp. MH4019]|uniref:hypothetical protein n=1 Tax=Cognatishimia sp. MH4019 TaxID=2854030 RepID=UPI001CD2EA4B|nr:hypothetical protein [Cognatishimia sp. MH4019]